MKAADPGKICIPISGRTRDALRAALAAAAAGADIIEIRFDGLNSSELEMLEPAAFDSKQPLIRTLRPAPEGGARDLSLDERNKFWLNAPNDGYCDAEEDIAAVAFAGRTSGRICSFHDFSGTPEAIEPIFDRLAAPDADIVKIAVTARTAPDALEVWKILDLAKKRGIRAIPIAMGEAGKWTRILGPAYGGVLTYASLAEDAGTAPGQISAADMRTVFRVNEITPKTRVYGIIAGDTSYSLSPWMHNAAFRAANIDAVFVPFQVSAIDEFFRRMVRSEMREAELNLAGFAVTNPHKQTIMSLLDEIDETAAAIGAVNTVEIRGDRLIGHNTDAAGFISPLKKLLPDMKGTRAAIVGAGGAARACAFALQAEGAEVTIFARDEKKARDLGSRSGISSARFEPGDKGLFSDHDILVNATPLGTRGVNENSSIADAENLKGLQVVYDLIYNPQETRLLKAAALAGVRSLGGLDMLVAQGAKQFELWTGQAAPEDAMREAAEKKLMA